MVHDTKTCGRKTRELQALRNALGLGLYSHGCVVRLGVFVCACAAVVAGPQDDLYCRSCCSSHRDISGGNSRLLLLHMD